MPVVTKSASTSGGRPFTAWRNDNDLATLREATDELLPLMRSARRKGDCATALLVATMIQVRLESLTPGAQTTAPEGSIVSRLRREISCERSTTEGLFCGL